LVSAFTGGFYEHLKMNAEKLNALYTERINSFAPYIRSIPDDDLRQEACIGIYEALKSDPEGTDRYLTNRAKWRQSVSLRKGCSVDNGFYKRDELEIVHYDQMDFKDGVFSQVVSENRNVSLDDLVIDKLCLEGLLNDLTKAEMEVFQYKVVHELWDKQIRKKLGIGYDRLNEIKDGLKLKICRYFSE